MNFSLIARALAAALAIGVVGPAAATVTSGFNGGTGALTVSSDAGDDLVVGCATGSVTINLAPIAGPVACGAVVSVDVDGGPGANLISLAAMTAVDFALLTTVTIDGGAGADNIVGSFRADVIHGDGDNDTIDGNNNPAATVDQVFGDDGDDTMIWNPGKNDDLNEGGPGFDTSVIVGGGAAETFTIAPDAVNVGRIDFVRTAPAPFFVDIGTTERLIVNANAGDDSITGSAGLNGLIALELNGGDNNDTIVGGDGVDIIHGGNGNDSLDGNNNPVATVDEVFGDDGDDTMVWNPGKNDDLNEGGPGFDTSVIVGGPAAETFTIAPDLVNVGRIDFARTTPAPFFVDIGTTERLIVNANVGNDIISGSAGLNGLIALELNGGDGNDVITGGDGVDTLHGGNNDDTLDGGDNPAATIEQIFGDDGNDTMIWNPGKDDDLNEGGPGSDTAIVNGGPGAEQFSITQVGARVRFARTNNAPAPFFIDIGSTELLQLNAEAGADRVTTIPLTGTEQVLDGGTPGTVPGDELIVVGFSGTLANGPITIPGFGVITASGFEFAPAQAPAKTFTAALDGAQEVPPVDTTGVGRGSVSLNAAEDEITVQLGFSDLGGNNTMAHIHGPAAVGTNAGVLFDLGNSGSTSGTLGPLTFAVSPQQAADLKAGLWYFNVHSTANASGEIRGQILADRVIEAFLSGAQQVPQVATTATGFGTVTLAGPEDAVTVTLNYIGLAGTNTLTRINGPAPRGQTGAEVVVLNVSNNSSATFTTAPIEVTATEVAQLKRGDWYFEVQSSAHPAGELRGQIDQAQYRDSFE